MSGRSPTRIKVHRRTTTLDGRRHTVLSLRPGTGAAFATNRYHHTWHVLSSVWHARLLGRLCWAMAYQRRPRTLFAVDYRHLVPNPFDGDPSWPIVIVNLDLGGLRPAAADDLAALLPFRTAPDGTVALQTHGLDQAELTGEGRCWIDRSHGLLVLAATSTALKDWAVLLSCLGTSWYRGSDEVRLDDFDVNDGEVQVFRDFRRRVVETRIARQRLFGDRRHLTPREVEALYGVDITKKGWPARAEAILSPP